MAEVMLCESFGADFAARATNDDDDRVVSHAANNGMSRRTHPR